MKMIKGDVVRLTNGTKSVGFVADIQEDFVHVVSLYDDLDVTVPCNEVEILYHNYSKS